MQTPIRQGAVPGISWSARVVAPDSSEPHVYPEDGKVPAPLASDPAYAAARGNGLDHSERSGPSRSASVDSRLSIADDFGLVLTNSFPPPTEAIETNRTAIMAQVDHGHHPAHQSATSVQPESQVPPAATTSTTTTTPSSSSAASMPNVLTHAGPAGSRIAPPKPDDVPSGVGTTLPYPSPSSTASSSPAGANGANLHALSHPLFPGSPTRSTSVSELASIVNMDTPSSPGIDTPGYGRTASSSMHGARFAQSIIPNRGAPLHSSVSSSAIPSIGSTGMNRSRGSGPALNPWSQGPRSVMEAIQEDFPRTPSLLQEDFPVIPPVPSVRSSEASRHPAMSADVDNMARLVASLDVGRSLDDVAVPSPRRGVGAGGSGGGHHRRSASINWTGDTSLFSGATSGPSAAVGASTPQASAVEARGHGSSRLPSGQTQKSLADIYGGQQAGSDKPPRAASPPTAVPFSRGLPMHTPSASVGRSVGSTTLGVGLPGSGIPGVPGQRQVPIPAGSPTTPSPMPSPQQNQAGHAGYYVPPSDPRRYTQHQAHVDPVTPDISSFDYLYDRSPSVGDTSGQVPGLMEESATGSTPAGSYALPLSAYSNAFQGMNPSLPTLSGLPSTPAAYPDASNAAAFREGLAAADSLKTMSIQMAAFFNAHQHLYAAQVAQMAAMTNGNANLAANPGFGIGVNAATQGTTRSTRSSKGSDSGRAATGSRKDRSGGAGGARGGRRGARLHEDAATDSPHIRSALLEEFRSTSIAVSGVAREWQLRDIQDHVVEFATDQHGSRFIQQKLESATPEELSSVLTNALADAHRLITDVFGNYVVQKLLEHGDRAAVAAIAERLEGRMLILSLHMYGCRVVQKALEVLETSARAKLIRELDGYVTKCIHDQNANHVIQKCIEVVEPENMHFIVDAVQSQAVSLAGHSYGCRVVQRLLEHGSEEQKAPIMREIMASIAELIKDTFANYVVQHIVEHGTVSERSFIIEFVRQDVCQLSQHKFASNVVERCLQHGSAPEREVLIEILIGENVGTSPLNDLVRDSFGNYVVQRILDVAKPSQKDRVVNILRLQVPTIKKYSYGKHIIARLGDEITAPLVSSAPNHGSAAPGGVSVRSQSPGYQQF